MSCATSGATIRYTTDGSTPTGSSTAYSSAINVSSTTTLKAIAFKTSVNNSATQSQTYTIGSCSNPGAFSQSSPSSGATGQSRTITFTWGASSSATGYNLVVANNSSYTSPIINKTGLTSTSFKTDVFLAASTVYYWKVTATNGGCSTNASNQGISFTTTSSSALNYFVATSANGGNDGTGNGTPGKPWLTVSYAASQVAGGVGHTINVGAGTFSENSPIMLNAKVNLDGDRNGTTYNTTITKGASFDVSNTNYDDATGSLIQAVSTALPSAPADGSQTISDLIVDGASRSVKCGVWVRNRNNVTMTYVKVQNTNYRGAVFSPGYKDWYIEPQYYMTGISINNCAFTNTSADIAPNGSLGALCISGLDGATIHTITINDDEGYGLKFIYDGYFKNCTIYGLNVTVPETDSQWNEDISVELWNFGANNKVYDVICNTWLSFVNHQAGPFMSPTSAGQYLKVYNVRMIDGDGSSSKEAVEFAVPGSEIYSSYFQNKPFGIACWDAGRSYITIRNNIFYNSSAMDNWADAGGVYIDNSTTTQYTNINIYHNVFDNMSNSSHGTAVIRLKSVNTGGIGAINIKNNVFLNGTGDDVATYASAGTITAPTFTNNLKGSGSWAFSGASITATNCYISAPGFNNSGNRYDNYYKPSSSGSYCVDKGATITNLNGSTTYNASTCPFPYTGSSPEIGRWEFNSSYRQITEEAEVKVADDMIQYYPNPTSGMLTIEANADMKILAVQVMNAQGKVLHNQAANKVTKVQLDLSNFNNDLYLLKIKHEKGQLMKKVILKK
jgi:hypothetical protein